MNEWRGRARSFKILREIRGRRYPTPCDAGPVYFKHVTLWIWVYHLACYKRWTYTLSWPYNSRYLYKKKKNPSVHTMTWRSFKKYCTPKRIKKNICFEISILEWMYFPKGMSNSPLKMCSKSRKFTSCSFKFSCHCD